MQELMNAPLNEHQPLTAEPPAVTCVQADAAFRALAAKMGYKPDSPWIDGYVNYEWNHNRHFLQAGQSLAGRRVLEFGCNCGATAIILAMLGAKVDAVDVDAGMVELAGLNLARHGLAERVSLHHVSDTRKLPWSDGAFDAIICCSVLEYVPPEHRRGVLLELNRVLAAGGLMYVLGTSNRLSPREVHTGRWFVNYLPSRLVGRGVQQGIGPFALRRALRGFVNIYYSEGREDYLLAKQQMGTSGRKLMLLKQFDKITRIFGLAVGELTPSINAVYRRLSQASR